MELRVGKYDHVVAVDDLVAVVGARQLAYSVGVMSLDLVDLIGAVARDAAGHLTSVRAQDRYSVAPVEPTPDLGDSRRQQAAALIEQRPDRSHVHYDLGAVGQAA